MKPSPRLESDWPELVVVTVTVNAPGVAGVATNGEVGTVQVALEGAPEQLTDNDT
jgi:hypothetical protein